jgi:predicted HAD superfamily hydrolase
VATTFIIKFNFEIVTKSKIMVQICIKLSFFSFFLGSGHQYQLQTRSMRTNEKWPSKRRYNAVLDTSGIHC